MELKENEFVVKVNLEKLTVTLNIEKDQSLLHAQFLNDIISAGTLNLDYRRHKEWIEIQDKNAKDKNG